MMDAVGAAALLDTTERIRGYAQLCEAEATTLAQMGRVADADRSRLRAQALTRIADERRRRG